MKIGIGYDIHRLVEGRKLFFGGINIPHDKGLLGHSDGDALLHAIADAMLGALALGDIGMHFSDKDPDYKDIDSKLILSKIFELVSKKGWSVSNIDSNIIAEEPKMAPFIPEMRKKIAEITGLGIEDISVKARTNEKLDAIGKGEAIAVQAIVLLKKKSKKD